MSKSQSLQRILALAKEKENKYEWVNAIKFYENASESMLKSKDFLGAGEITKQVGHCLHRAAFQAKTNDDFQGRMRLAVKAYKRATGLFWKIERPENRAKGAQCNAMANYADSWITEDPTKKKELLNQCLELESEALRLYEKAEDAVNIGKTCNSLMLFLIDLVDIEWNGESRERMIEEAMEYGEEAIKIFSGMEDKHQLALAYNLTGRFCIDGAFAKGFRANKREDCRQKAFSYPQKAKEISEEIGDSHLIAESNLCLAKARADILGAVGPEEKKYAEKALEQGTLTGDNLLIAKALVDLLFLTGWDIWSQEDPDKVKEEYEKVNKYFKEALHHFSLIDHNAGMASTYFCLAFATRRRAEIETDLEDKYLLFEKSVQLGYNALENLRLSGSILMFSHVTLGLSDALVSLANVETDVKRKRHFLEESSKYVEKGVNAIEQASAVATMEPKDANLGMALHVLAQNQSELANIEEESEKKISILKKAVINMQHSLKSMLEWVKSQQAEVHQHYWFVLGKSFAFLGNISNQLWSLTDDRKLLREIVVAFQQSIEMYGKAETNSRVAEGYWQLAKTQNKLQNYAESAENFQSAYKNFLLAAEKIPQLKGFYQDHAYYMEAWNEIEKAKYHHAKRQYRQAKEHYKKTANLHESIARWNYLSQNYLAWAKLEEAEDLSRKEQTEEAKDLLEQSAKLFLEAKKSIKAKLEKIEYRDEKEMAAKLVKASDTRREYCLGRIALEEAKILDRQGDHAASSGKYASATEKFQKAIDNMEHESDRQELRPIVCLCQAWQMMTQAEAEASPNLYSEASELFNEAKEHSSNEKAKLLALGHSAFCKALEAGTKFEATRDTTLHLAATQHLEGAANYYVKAGFKTAAEYAKATQRLFDAYVYMDSANKETDPEKKARYYMMAQRVLQISAGSYMKAKHPEKRNQVQRLLEKVSEERQLAASLSDVLHAPTITSSTSSFVTPTPAEEKAVGLERFEHAAIEANLVLSSKEPKAGENFNLEMQITNVGKEAALLAKVEGILPPGFDLFAKPDYCHFEDAHLDMKGKKLNPLKTEDIRLALRSFDKGTFEIKPRIVCVDGTGHRIFCEPEPVTIKVSEVVLPGRITTGYGDLDKLLFGGIPENYSVILTSPSCDERGLLIKRFLEAGAKEGQITFYVTTEAGGVRTLAEGFQSNFYLFTCSPRADIMIKSLPNVFKLKGVENLTDISISLTSAFRKLDAPIKGPRRACIEIVSDVLLQHHAVTTRRWLAGLIPDLRSKGFTTLAVMNPLMHPSEEVHAILGLFEGEINIYEKESEKGLEKFLKIRKMYNQRYLDNELSLRKERLET